MCVHWNVLDDYRNLFPASHPDIDQIFIDEGDLLTCAGSTAAIDMGLYLINRHCGPHKARQAMRHMVLQNMRPPRMPQPHFGSQLPMISDVRVRLAAQFIPEAPANDPALTINWNPLSETWRNLRHAKADPKVFLALVGISWMWFFGAVFLSQFPSFAKEILHGNAQVASLLLVVFSVGIAIGSLLCEVLGRRQVELGLVPLGAIGMSLFTVDLYFAARGLPPSALMDAAAFLQQAAHWRVMADLGLLSLSAGLYSVPLYALIQWRTAPSHRARIIAANNILNALFMIASALLAGALLTAGLDMAQVFLCVGLANALVTLYVFVQDPDYGKRMKALLLRWTVRS